MAFTVSTVINTVVGNERLWGAYVTPDSAENTVQVPGATYIDHIVSIFPYNTATCGCFQAVPNAGTTATALGGYIGFSSVVSGGKYFVTVLYH